MEFEPKIKENRWKIEVEKENIQGMGEGENLFFQPEEQEKNIFDRHSTSVSFRKAVAHWRSCTLLADRHDSKDCQDARS